MSRYDVIVVGAGPGGAAAAYFLSKNGANVLLLDKAKFPRDKTCGDALSPRALIVIRKMGVLREVEDRGYVTDSILFIAPNSKKVATSLSPVNSVPRKIVIIRRYILDHILCRTAIKQGAELHEGIKVLNIENDEAGVSVTGKSNGRNVKYFGRAVIIATGASTNLLLKTGIIKKQPEVMFATRGYYENIDLLDKEIQFIYSDISLPGYGWIFPTSDNSANIGAGFFKSRNRRNSPNTSMGVFTQLINSPRLRKLLATANRVGKIQGFPLRIDFPNSKTYAKNMIVVGEAAGLVNPLTGEGIDYSLESGQIAAEELTSSLSNGDFTFANYDLRLRERYNKQFIEFERIRKLFFGNKMALNIFFAAIEKDKELMSSFLNIVVGYENPRKMVSLDNLWRYVFAM